MDHLEALCLQGTLFGGLERGEVEDGEADVVCIRLIDLVSAMRVMGSAVGSTTVWRWRPLRLVAE